MVLCGVRRRSSKRAEYTRARSLTTLLANGERRHTSAVSACFVKRANIMGLCYADADGAEGRLLSTRAKGLLGYYIITTLLVLMYKEY